MSRYDNGANFERQIIASLLQAGYTLVMRGAGSKSYGKIKADIIALQGRTVLIIQAKKKGKASSKDMIAFREQVKKEFPYSNYIPFYMDKELFKLMKTWDRVGEEK